MLAQATTRATLAVALLLLASVSPLLAAEQGVTLRFYAPLDEHLRGILLPHRVGIEATNEFVPAPAKCGGAAAVRGERLGFPLVPFLSNEEGAVAVWVKIGWSPEEPATRTILNLGRFANLNRWQSQPYLTYPLWYHHLDEKHDYGCTAPLAGWGPGQWHHVVLSWSWSGRKRTLFLDGKKVREAPIARIPNKVTAFEIGPDVDAADELCVYAGPVDEAEVDRLYQAGSAGRPAFAFAPIPPVRGAVERLPDSRAAAPPAFVQWSFEGAEQRANERRAEVTLNGWWRWQRGATAYEAPDDSRWLYRKVPAHSSFTESFPARDEACRVVSAADPRVDSQRLDGIPQWCEREFTLPTAWHGRRITLRLDALMGEGAVFLNGRLLDALPATNLGGDYDVTDQVVWERPNRLTLFSSGVPGETSLLSIPAGPAIEDAWLTTSWRTRSVDLHLRVGTPRPETVVARLAIYDPHPARPVKKLELRRALRSGANELQLSGPWSDAIPWSPARPHLYTYTVQILDAKGALLDETHPTRFGFREIRIEGGDFTLNGVPIHFIGHSNAHVTAASELGDPEYLRYSLRRWRAAGLNCVTPWGHGRGGMPTIRPLLEAADEVGMAILPMANLPTGEQEAETPRSRAHWNALHRRYVERYRQHPSVLAWMVGSGAHNFDFCPAALGGEARADIPRAEPLRRTWAFVSGVDSTRPIFGLSNGDIGPVWTSMAYQGFDVDLQERENWPLAWSRKRHKPLMPCEFSLPYYRDWFARTRARSGSAQYSPKNTQSLATEYGAMLLGPSVYAAESEEYLSRLQESPGSPGGSSAAVPVKSLFAETLRAWRAYGVSFVYHAEVPGLFDGERPSFPSVAKLDPRRWGATADGLHGSLQAGEELSEFGQKVRDATAPLMAFVGGPDGRFTLKDHAYTSGEKVRKVLVLVNETEGEARFTAEWSLRDGEGKAAASGTLSTTVAPGRPQTDRARIEFPAPAVRERTDFTLVVTARVSGPGAEQAGVGTVAAPPFGIAVFPASGAAASGGTWVLFDPVGETRAALARIGVVPAPMPSRLAPEHRLLVGRRALADPAGRKALEAAGFDDAVARGMRVLLFEQAAPEWEGSLLGLRLKRLATRRAFIRAPGHPAFAGLDEADFRYLRGDSDLIEAYPAVPALPAEYPLHFWHWGNDHIVATYALEKPQVGASRALLDCGFDLAESALLEVARGEGLLLFCQVDVTNRLGTDPVSTRLVTNLLGYLQQAQVRPGASPPLAQLLEGRKPGAHVEGYRWAPPALPGINAGDLFFRQKVRLPAFEAGSDAPLFARAEGERWVTSLTGAELPDAWSRARRARAEAALCFLNGERTPDGPELRRFDDAGRLYPERWNRLPKMEDDFDPYVYWRW